MVLIPSFAFLCYLRDWRTDRAANEHQIIATLLFPRKFSSKLCLNVDTRLWY